MSFTSIPILDLDLSRDPATKPEFLDQLRNALMEVGFLYLKNVGISDELWNEVIKEGKEFFDIPQEEKYDLSILPLNSLSSTHTYTHINTCMYMLAESFGFI